MLGVDNTSEVLYRYLRLLNVKVSKVTVCHLLDNPVGNSMRGISDALDALHVDNAVYQLPTEYLAKLEIPFIAVTEDNNTPFCLVEQIEEGHIIFTAPHTQRMRVGKQQFQQKWTGGVLVGETTKETIQEKDYWLKNIMYHIDQYKLLFAGVVATILILYGTNINYPAEISFYLLTLCIGIFVSTAILYKETINKQFLHRFCHIGNAIDCNEVLHSKGSHIMGVGLGELSLFYFSTLLLFTLIRPYDFYAIGVMCCIVATIFTLYSVVYQIVILHKGCMLCMLINLTIWSNCIALFLLQHQFYITIKSTLSLVAISCICLVAGLQIRSLLKAYQERNSLKNQLAGLLNPEAFRKLLYLNPQIKEMISHELTLHNHITSEKQLMIITNPNCKGCAKMHPHIVEIASHISTSLVILTFPNDRLGERVAQIVITAYLMDGWEKAMLLLGEWYETQQIKEIEKYHITDDAQKLWKQQQLYCWQQKISQTPSVIVDKHHVPEMYQLTELKYVLT